MNKIILHKKVTIAEPVTILDFLKKETGLSKTKIKDAMNKGAAWKKTGRGKRKRIRRTQSLIRSGDFLEFYYDTDILLRIPPFGKLLNDLTQYSIWYKPEGLMAQGTDYGDHCSLLRQAELFFQNRREVFPVHRLDRETPGLVILAHSKDAAKKLSCIFQDRKIVKYYRAAVLGNLGEQGKIGEIKIPLDGKESITEYQVEGYDSISNIAMVHVRIKTGRKHQIRRHFAKIGFPVMGDPKYGKENKNSKGLQLKAIKLEFKCPFQQKQLVFSVE